LKTVLPLIGKLLTSNKDAYQYLCNSIHAFVEPLHLQKMLEQEGFVRMRIVKLTGGIATLILAKKEG
jgi:demethylmenaquinone methyltransferase / 2-methoxy-6-polyprenyl-1,4-benzoquinol methylase